ATSILKEASIQLQQLEKFQPEIAELSERLRSCLIEVKDIADEVESMEQSTSFNEERAVEINERLSGIYSLQKKHRVSSVAELLQIQQDLSAKRNHALNSDENIEQLEKEIEKEKASLKIGR